MDRLMLPLGPLGVRLVDTQQLPEVQQRVLEHDPPFELADGKVSLPDSCPIESPSGNGGRNRSQGFELRQIRAEVRRSGIPGQASRQLAGPLNLLIDPLRQRTPFGLKQPVRYQRRVTRPRVVHRQAVLVQQVAPGLLPFLLAQGTAVDENLGDVAFQELSPQRADQQILAVAGDLATDRLFVVRTMVQRTLGDLPVVTDFDDPKTGLHVAAELEVAMRPGVQAEMRPRVQSVVADGDPIAGPGRTPVVLAEQPHVAARVAGPRHDERRDGRQIERRGVSRRRNCLPAARKCTACSPPSRISRT